MPVLFAMFVGWLLTLIPALVAKVVLALGVGVASYTGFNLIVSGLRSAVMGAWSGVSGDIATFCGILQLDVCTSIWLSAVAMKVTINTVNGVINKISFSNKNLPA